MGDSQPTDAPTDALTDALGWRGALVLDGAMATELERRGADLSGGLWSARVLQEQPSLVAEVHRAYLEAGADVITTASYQASTEGYAGHGVSRGEAERLIHLSVTLAADARDRYWDQAGDREHRPRPLVATSVGPYGAVLADGSEYRGHYDLSAAELVRFHRTRLEVLIAAGVEVLACETIPSLVETHALVEALGDWPMVSAWVSFSARDGQHVSDGTLVADCAAYLQGQDQVVAVGVNCTALEHIPSLIREIDGVTDKPIVVYPNSGETWDARAQAWVGDRSADDFGALAEDWYAAGARLIGGCCRTGPDDIRRVASTLGARANW